MIALLILVLSSLFSSGFVATYALKFEFRGVLRVAIIFGLGVFLHGIEGLVIGLLDSHEGLVASLFIVTHLLVFLSLIFSKRIRFNIVLSLHEKIALMLWPVFVASVMFMAHISFEMPKDLFDGPYVFKNHNLHVRIQTINGHLPGDNYIPFVASEFMLRDLSFKDNRPMVPGQEVVNRTFLMPLVGNVFRAAVNMPPKHVGRLDTFEYVSTQWPNVVKFGIDENYRQFLVVGVILNSLLYLLFLVLMKRFGGSKILLIGATLFLLNPYFISQTMFIWPKNLAAFYIGLGAILISEKKNLILAGFFLGLAYNSHPLAILFAVPFTLFLIQKQQVAKFLVTFIVMLLPWKIWTELILNIDSDLVAQNLFADLSIVEFIWIRLHNTYQLLMPTFFGSPRLELSKLFEHHLISAPFVIGLFYFFFAVVWLYKNKTLNQFWVLTFAVFPLILMVGVHSKPAVTALHGFQAIYPFLYTVGLVTLRKEVNSIIFSSVFLFQLLFFLIVLFQQYQFLMNISN